MPYNFETNLMNNIIPKNTLKIIVTSVLNSKNTQSTI